MAEMKKLELTPEEAKESFPFLFDKEGKPQEGTKIPKFPEGVELHLGNVVLKKLGMTSKDFKLGEEMTLSAVVKVEGSKLEESLGEEPRMLVKLQMTMLGIGVVDKPLEELIFKD